jgi:5'(3')-deoxyribonucleotidase
MFSKKTLNKKPIIAVDVDDTLLDTLNPLLEYFNSTHDNYVTREQCFDNRLATIFGDSEKEGLEKVRQFFDLPQAEHQQPILGAVEAIQNLKNHFSLIALTARWDTLQELTEKQLKKHFPGTFSDVVCCGDVISKKDYCTAKRINHIIDDAPRTAHECAKNGINSFLFGDYGWNKEYQKIPGLSRTLNWTEVCDILLP